MNGELAPGRAGWLTTISSSKVPIILGLSPWSSPFALWHEMAGNVAKQEMDEGRAKVGHYAELMLVPYWLAENPGWVCERTSELSYEQTFTADYGYPAVATVDAVAEGPDGERCIVECKTTNDMSHWGRPGELNSVPAHYYAQVVWQMGVSGIHQAQVIVEAFHRVEIHHVEWDAGMFDGMVAACADWWRSLQDGEEPALDDREATYATVRGLHPDIDPGTEHEISPQDAVALMDAKHTADNTDKHYEALKAQHMHAMGNAQTLTSQGERIATRYPGKYGVNFKLNPKAQVNP